MGRKADPRGKDRPRTIVLSGDVAEIAQNLAEKSQLSAVISDLLRRAYGGGEAINDMKRELEVMIDARKELQLREEEMIERITKAEDELLTQRNHILPSLYMREGVLTERIAKLEERLKIALNPQDQARFRRQIEETSAQLSMVFEQIKELEE